MKFIPAERALRPHLIWISVTDASTLGRVDAGIGSCHTNKYDEHQRQAAPDWLHLMGIRLTNELNRTVTGFDFCSSRN